LTSFGVSSRGFGIFAFCFLVLGRQIQHSSFCHHHSRLRHLGLRMAINKKAEGSLLLPKKRMRNPRVRLAGAEKITPTAAEEHRRLGRDFGGLFRNKPCRADHGIFRQGRLEAGHSEHGSPLLWGRKSISCIAALCRMARDPGADLG